MGQCAVVSIFNKLNTGAEIATEFGKFGKIPMGALHFPLIEINCVMGQIRPELSYREETPSCIPGTQDSGEGAKKLLRTSRNSPEKVGYRKFGEFGDSRIASDVFGFTKAANSSGEFGEWRGR